MTLDLRIVDEVDWRLAELSSASGKAWAGPIKNTVPESKRGADRAWSVHDRERLALNIEIRRDIAAIDTQELTTTDIVLPSR